MTGFMCVTQQRDEFTVDFKGLVPCDLSKRNCFVKYGLLESTPPVPQLVRLHMLLARGPDKSLEAHMDNLTPDQVENWHPTCYLSTFGLKASRLECVGAFPIQHQLNTAT